MMISQSERERNHLWYLANAEAVKARARAYALAHKDDPEHKRKRAASLKAWSLRNKEKNTAQIRAWKLKHRAQETARAIRWQKANPEKVRASRKKYWAKNHGRIFPAMMAKLTAWKEAHPDRVAAQNAARAKRRKIRETKVCPPWVKTVDLIQFYDKAKRITRETGVPHEVDHIFPIQPRCKKFSGLHVPWNLQVLTRAQNRVKSNHAPEIVTSTASYLSFAESEVNDAITGDDEPTKEI